MRCPVSWIAKVVGFGLLLAVGGCATYGGIVRPTPELGFLSPAAENLTDADIEAYLQASAPPLFPTVLAVAKLKLPRSYYRSYGDKRLTVDQISGDEADGWRRLTGVDERGRDSPIQQVQFVNKLAVAGEPTLKNLRDAAAKLHAPLLLAYIQEDNRADGQNSAAIAYWTIVGLFTVPGNTVGYHSVCEGILVDTRTGAIVATVAGEAKREENVVAAAVSIARDRLREESHAEAISSFQRDFNRILTELVKAPVAVGTISDRQP